MSADGLSERNMRGTRIGDRFTIEELAAQGGMGTVFRAHDERTRQPVALKLLSESTAMLSERFEREAELLAALDHPGIVRHIAHGTARTGELYLAMEWLEGEDLEARLKRGPLPAQEAVSLAHRVAETLTLVHKNGIVHRDIKPSNVFLHDGSLERPKLLDFGIARRSGAAALTRTGGTLGTPQYMAPEQVRGARDVDSRADVFSLGAVLFECLTGRPAFTGEHAMAVLAKVLLDDPPRLSDLCDGAPATLDRLVADMLAKRPEHRPNDAAELVRRLAKSLEELLAGTAPTLAQGRPQLTVRERRLVCVVLALDESSEVQRTLSTDELAQFTDRLRQVVVTHGGELTVLGAHQVLVTLPATGVATDQATRAARTALALSAELPSASVSLAMGFADTTDRNVSEVIDRAASLLRSKSRRVRIDEVSAGLLEVRFQLSPIDDGYELLGERDPAERPRPVLGQPTECVGRERELAVLDGMLEEAIAESTARAILVTGAPGVGKSRLRYEFIQRIREGGTPVAVWIARAEAMRSGSPLDLLAQLVRAGTSLEPSDAAQARERLSARVRQRVSSADEQRDVAEFLGEIVGAGFDDADSPRLAAARRDPRLMGEQMLRAWLALVAAECSVHPLLLVIEDLHWGDAQTVRYLDTALRELGSRPLVVLALARPDVHERFAGLWRERPLEEIRLRPLSARASERLVRQLLSDVGSETLERLVRHAEGNPLYLEEIIRAAAAGSLEAMPASVVAMVQARLEALESNARRTLRAASIFGESFGRDGVVELLARQAADFDAARELDRLVEREVLVRREQEYAFRHALVREAAYAMVTEEDRTLGHGLAARWLEERGEPDALLLAEHYVRAGESADAARFCARAAHQALRKNDFDAVLRLGQRAIDLGAHDLVRIDALAARGEAYLCLGRWGDAQRELEEALSLTPPHGDERVGLLRLLWQVSLFRQDSPSLRQIATEVLELARASGGTELMAEAHATLSVAAHCDARPDEALQLMRAALQQATDQPSSVLALATMVLYHCAAYEECEQGTRKLLASAQQIGDSQTAVIVGANLGLALVGQGRYREAEDHFADARALAVRSGLTTMLARTVSISAGYLAEIFDDVGSEQRALEAREIGAALEFATPRVSSALDLIGILARRGELERAQKLMDTIDDVVANGAGFHGWLWRARMEIFRAQMAAGRGDWEQALSGSAGAVQTCRNVRRIKYRMAAHLIHARALDALGRRDDAIRELSEACTEAHDYPDPAMLLRPCLALLSLRPDAKLVMEACELASRIEAALPDETIKSRFRAAPELTILG